ncbi:uncharacterized protein LOC123300788 isoform X2 [Chrysoperla carnea]|uniref:uncharacterized protein LOC123300788 isoform X2 n=1 Tax=Chrysoperla carnea TaxID=189513 RepID=UPI001D06C063|nr:uncharacterized protein LOC123300788 isoform X2 [Chrysoperla carnea]
MATTAKLRGSKFPDSGEEDIAAIAKQISDHAEAIYQTWKSRGLAPTEILNCHSNAQAADKFGSTLTPQQQTSSVIDSSTIKSPVVDLLQQTQHLDNNHLEKFVNNFVSEDKAARMAAARQKSPAKSLPSSIQFALQKFESNLQSPSSTTSATTTYSNNNNNNLTKPSSTKPQILQKPQISPKPALFRQELLSDTIETIFPPDLQPQKPQTPKRPTYLVQNSSSSMSQTDSSTVSSTTSPTAGLQTWPLKNKIESPKRTVKSTLEQISAPQSLNNESSKYATLPSSKNSPSYLDEVAREEERLINALKTGVIIAEDRTTPERTLSSKKNKSNGSPSSPSPSSFIKKDVSPSREAVSCYLTSPPSNQDRPLSKDDRNDLSNMSIVDYAKVRYRAAQQTPQQRLDDVIGKPTIERSETPVAAIVSRVRNKFEPPTASTGGAGDQKTSDVVDMSTRWGLRPRPRTNSGTNLNSTENSHHQNVPHPELTNSQRQHIRAAAAATNSSLVSGNNPVRPFLTRGSVAERVLIFEKCPSELLLDKQRSRTAPAINTWRNGHEVHHKAQTFGRKEISSKPLPAHTTLQRHIKANRNVFIPRFYFPQGKPVSPIQYEQTLQRIQAAFAKESSGLVTKETCSVLTEACELPHYWKVPLFNAVARDNKSIDVNKFIEFWKQMVSQCHDPASRFVYILTQGQRTWLCPEDFISLIQDVVDSHPGLTFLKEATEFHSRYVHTVIARIFYCVNRSWSGRISISELRRSNLLSVIQLLEEEEDINQVTAYFSYEHFYVIYCKFWELDRDHDLMIDRQDLTKHNDHALSSRIIDRIFSGAVNRNGPRSLSNHREEKMSYTDFVWFLLSEEDKMHPTAVEYWFRCMDLDGDGFLSMYELEYFYEEQMQRMEAIGIETLPFEDCLCQMLDMVKPAQLGKIALGDLKKCKMTPIFFDTFFNLEKYLDHEQRDPFASQRDHDGEGHELSDWDRYAAEEYELLVAEEGGDQQDQISFDENDCVDQLSTSLDMILSPDIYNNDVLSKNTLNNNSLSQSQLQQSQPMIRTYKCLINEDWNDLANNSRPISDDDDDYAQDSDECSI